MQNSGTKYISQNKVLKNIFKNGIKALRYQKVSKTSNGHPMNLHYNDVAKLFLRLLQKQSIHKV